MSKETQRAGEENDQIQAKGINYQRWTAKSSNVTHPVLGTCSLANCPTRVFAAPLFCKNRRSVKIIILLHLESMTFVRRWFLMNPGADVRTIETTMWSFSFPWKESTLNTVFSQGSPAVLSAFSIAFRSASYGVMILKFLSSRM